MRSRIRLSVAFVCCALGGCMVGPDYKRPDVDTPRTYIYEPKDAVAADLDFVNHSAPASQGEEG